jgi:hypothetical protein
MGKTPTCRLTLGTILTIGARHIAQIPVKKKISIFSKIVHTLPQLFNPATGFSIQRMVTATYRTF